MDGSKENHLGLLMPSSDLQGGSRMEGIKLMKEMTAQNNIRRALSSINQNIMEATRNQKPCVINRGDLSMRCTAPQTVQHTEVETEMLSCHQSDCTIIDVEDEDDEEEEYEDADGDSAVPEFVKHTEAMLDEIDEIDRIEEVDMEDLVEPVMDIDEYEKMNPLAVVEYIDDIHTFYKKSEKFSCVSPDYMTGQFDINERMRAILIDWLIEVHYKFELMEETLFLTVNLIDRFLERHSVIRKKLQLVGVTAMLLACKYEEVTVPTVEDFILITDKAYKRQEILDMEKLMTNTLEFTLSVPTPYVFLKRFLKAAQSDKKVGLMSFYIIELCLVEYKMLKFSPSLLAAAAIYSAQCSLFQYRHWSRTFEWYSNYSEDQLQECSRMMVSFHQKAGTGKLTGVFRKYSTWKYCNCSRVEPALFLLEE